MKVLSSAVAVLLSVSSLSLSSTTTLTLSFCPLALAFSPSSDIISLSRSSSSRSSSLKISRRGSRSTSTSALNLADEIKDYRKGLSQIHKSSSSYNNDNNNNNNNNSSSNNNNNNNTNKKKIVECVFKFGGSSLATADRIDHVARLIRDQIELGYRPRAVVCSAMGKTTNNLLSAGEFALEGQICVDAIRTLHMNTMDTFEFTEESHTRNEVNQLLTECEQMLTGVKMIQELSPKSLDQLVSYGERCCVRIMAARLNQLGVPAQSFESWDIGIHTDSNFGDAKLLPSYEASVQKAFNNRIDPETVAVVTGFIGHDPNGKITTLGRGGSDLTATAIGAALRLDEIQVWKDVDGILSTDPRVVPHDRVVALDQVSFEEASELAYFGAQVLHPIAMQPAQKYNVPVRVKNSYNPSAVGTIIREEKSPMQRLVTAITFKKDVTVLDICSTQMLGAYGFLARVFGEFEKHKLSVDVLASSEVSVSLTLDRKQDTSEVNALIEDLSDCSNVVRKDNYSILTLIADTKKSSEVLATVFRVFSSQNIQVEMMSQGASKVNISFIIKSDRLEQAISQLHSCFFEGYCVVDDDDKTIRQKNENNNEEEKKDNVVAAAVATVDTDMDAEAP